MKGEFLNRLEAAELLGISGATIDRMRREKRILAPTRLGKRIIRWSKSELLQWMSEQSAAQRSV